MQIPKVGDPWSWTPAAFTNHGDDCAGVLGAVVRVNGRITYVNRAHGFFRAEASFPGGTIRECFKF